MPAGVLWLISVMTAPPPSEDAPKLSASTINQPTERVGAPREYPFLYSRRITQTAAKYGGRNYRVITGQSNRVITAVITRPKSGVVPRSYEKRRQSAPLIQANMPDHHGRSKDPQHGRRMRQKKHGSGGAGNAPKRETAAAVLRRLACCRDTAATCACAAAVRSPPVGRRVVVSWSHGVSAFVQRMRGDRGCVCVWLRSHDRAA